MTGSVVAMVASFGILRGVTRPTDAGVLPTAATGIHAGLLLADAGLGWVMPLAFVAVVIACMVERVVSGTARMTASFATTTPEPVGLPER